MRTVACPLTLDPVRTESYLHDHGMYCRDVPTGEVLPEYLREACVSLDILGFYEAQGIPVVDECLRESYRIFSEIIRILNITWDELDYHGAAVGIRQGWELVFVVPTAHIEELCGTELFIQLQPAEHVTRH